MAGYSVTYTVVDNATKQIDAINRRVAQMRAPMERMQRSVTRFVDVSGLRKVATGFEWIGKAAGTVLRTLTAIVPVMGAIVGAASIAGMVKLVSTYADWSHELVAAADNIGTTTQKLQQFEDATRLAGGNAATMRDSLKGLHDNLADFNRGGANAAVTGQWANKLKVNLRDANGQIRSAADLMPELLEKIAAMPDPADRAAAANALLGSSGDKLVETFRQSSRSFGDWFNDVKRYKDLTDEQKASLQRFGEAQGKLGVDFDRLGQQISAMVATHLGPLLEKFAAFVEQNTPAILGAIDQLVSRFAAWLNNPETGKAFVASVKSVADSLVWVSNNLDTIKTGVEVIAGLFALKWAGGIVSSIGAVTEAFGVVGVGGAAGIGLLGALGLVIWLSVEIVRHWSEIKQAGAELADSVGKSFDRVSKTMSDWWTGKHDPNDLPKPGETPSYPTQPAIPAPQQYLPQGGAPGGAWARPPGAIQKQSATGGYLPGGVTRASYGGGPLGGVGGGGGGVAAIGPSEFWDSMARAVAKGFEDAWDHITGIGGGGGGVGGGGGGGFQQASFRVPAPPAGGPSPNIGPGGRTPGALSPGAISSDVTPEGRALLANIAGGESGGDASILYGGGHFSDTSKFPEWAGKMGPAGISHAAGRYQFQPATWAAASKGAGVSDFTPASQDKAAWWLAQHDYRQRTGRDLGADLKDPSKASAIGAALGPTWTSANPGKWASGLQDKLKGAPVAAAPPVTVPPPQAPNGAVDVNITHKNPPPNSAVTASGSGAVNVAPVRVEHQNMADI